MMLMELNIAFGFIAFIGSLAAGACYVHRKGPRVLQVAGESLLRSRPRAALVFAAIYSYFIAAILLLLLSLNIEGILFVFLVGIGGCIGLVFEIDSIVRNPPDTSPVTQMIIRRLEHEYSRNKDDHNKLFDLAYSLTEHSTELVPVMAALTELAKREDPLGEAARNAIAEHEASMI